MMFIDHDAIDYGELLYATTVERWAGLHTYDPQDSVDCPDNCECDYCANDDDE